VASTFTYRVRDQGGKLVNGTIVADNEALVLNRLREMGFVPVQVTEKKEKALSKEFSFRPGHVKLKDLSIYSRQFATMVNSGLPILKALSILSEQTESKELAKVVTEVRMEVERGSSLSGAMAKHPKAFDNLYVSMIRAGEAGGVLDSVLLRLADNIEREVELRRRVKSAMTYPVVVLGMVTLILAAMLLFIVPQFKNIYAQLNGTLPLPTKILLAVSDAVRKFWWMWILVTIAGVWAFKRYRSRCSGLCSTSRRSLGSPARSRSCFAPASRSCRPWTSWRRRSTTTWSAGPSSTCRPASRRGRASLARSASTPCSPPWWSRCWRSARRPGLWTPCSRRSASSTTTRSRPRSTRSRR
jgi:type II secretory pathway component PulF